MRLSLFALLALAATPALAVEPIQLKISGITDGQPIPDRFAHCVPDAAAHTKNGPDISPGLQWSNLPKGTKSLALIVTDPDVPSKFDDANRADRTIPASLPRRDFYHWVLTDIPPSVEFLKEGIESRGPRIDPVGRQPYGYRGANSYGEMDHKAHGGYDGPCPPWNDARLHHYTFKLYALDTPSLGLSGDFSAVEALSAMQGHVLAEGAVTGTYTQNPGVK